MNLLAVAAEPAVSLYMPLHRSPTMTGQNRQRLQGLMRNAEDRLKKFGVDVYAMLVPALDHVIQRELLDRPAADGLAMFFSRDHVRSYALPYAPAARLSVGTGYDILSFLAANDPVRRFFVVTLDEAAAGLFHADAGSFGVLRSDLLDRFAAPCQAGLVPASEADPDRLARRIAATIDALLRQQNLPLVAVGSPGLIAHFREHCSYPALLPGGIVVSPAELDCARLHAVARAEVRRALDRPLQEAVVRVASAPAGGDDIVRFNHADIASGAERGLIETLLLADEVTSASTVPVGPWAGVPQFPDVDHAFANSIARATLTAGGRVHVVHAADLPHGVTAAALFRR